jgi:xanthine dehydrogenase YagS FAD-binding subunit
MAVAMRVLDATVQTVRADNSRRTIPIAELHRTPGSTPEVETVLARDEIITSVTLPAPLGGKHFYRKVRDRASYAFALVSVAAVIQPDGRGRFAYGGLAPKPWRVEAAEQHGSAQAIAQATLAGTRTGAHNAFKPVLLERTLASVLSEAKG